MRLVFLLAATLGAAMGQRPAPVAIGRTHAVAPVTPGRDAYAEPRPGPAGHPKAPYLMIGAGLGAVIGGSLAASFEDSFCGDPSTYYGCTATSPAEGAIIGAGVGLALGWLLWLITTPRP